MDAKQGPELFPDGQFTFEHQRGARTVDGKAYYPAALRLVVNHREALRLIELLARSLAEPDTGTDLISVTLSGSMRKLEGEG